MFHSMKCWVSNCSVKLHCVWAKIKLSSGLCECQRFYKFLQISRLGGNICQVTMTTKAAIVTGGAQGIGKAIAGTLLENRYKVSFPKFVWNEKMVEFSPISVSFHKFFRLFYSDINREKLSSNSVYFEATENWESRIFINFLRLGYWI